MNDEGEGEDVDGGQPDALVRGPHSRCDMSLVPTPLATTQAQTPKPTSSRRVLTLTLTGTPSPGPTPLTPTTNPDPNPQPQPLTPTLTLSRTRCAACTRVASWRAGASWSRTRRGSACSSALTPIPTTVP